MFSILTGVYGFLTTFALHNVDGPVKSRKANLMPFWLRPESNHFYRLWTQAVAEVTGLWLFTALSMLIL